MSGPCAKHSQDITKIIMSMTTDLKSSTATTAYNLTDTSSAKRSEIINATELLIDTPYFMLTMMCLEGKVSREGPKRYGLTSSSAQTLRPTDA